MTDGVKKRKTDPLKLLRNIDVVDLDQRIKSLERQLEQLRALRGAIAGGTFSGNATPKQSNGGGDGDERDQNNGVIEERISRLLTRYGSLSVAQIAEKLGLPICVLHVRYPDVEYTLSEDARRSVSRFVSKQGVGVGLR